jgi:hypothetical protein
MNKLEKIKKDLMVLCRIMLPAKLMACSIIFCVSVTTNAAIPKNEQTNNYGNHISCMQSNLINGCVITFTEISVNGHDYLKIIGSLNGGDNIELHAPHCRKCENRPISRTVENIKCWIRILIKA